MSSVAWPPPRYWRLHTIGWVIFGCVFAAASWPFMHLEPQFSLWRAVVHWGLWTVTGAGVSGLLVIPYGKLVLYGVRPSTTAWVLALSVLGACVWAGLLVVLNSPFLPLHMPPPPPPDWHPQGPPPVGLPVAMSAVLLFAAGWLAISFGVAEVRAKEREELLTSKNLATEARLEALHRELNPHFLFNALNTLVGLADEHPEAVKSTGRALAKILRYTLSHEGNFAALQEELDIAATFVEIQKTRFAENLDVRWNIEADILTAEVPVMLVQPLLENAIKHGMSSSDMPLRVIVTVKKTTDGVYLAVENSGKLAIQEGGSGLRNLAERLQHLYPDRHTLQLNEQLGMVCCSIALVGKP